MYDKHKLGFLNLWVCVCCLKLYNVLHFKVTGSQYSRSRTSNSKANIYIYMCIYIDNWNIICHVLESWLLFLYVFKCVECDLAIGIWAPERKFRIVVKQLLWGIRCGRCELVIGIWRPDIKVGTIVTIWLWNIIRGKCEVWVWSLGGRWVLGSLLQCYCGILAVGY
jgi:hypothetical protein